MGALVLVYYLIGALVVAQVIKFFLTWRPKNHIGRRRWRL